MHRGTLFRWLVALCVAAAAVAMPAAAIAASPVGSPVESRFEARHGKVDRDCGYSQTLPGRRSQSIWLFCDSQLPSGLLITGSTAAEGPFTRGKAPTGLIEVPSTDTPLVSQPVDRAPQRFLPVPGGVVRPNGGACGGSGAFAASWITGVAREPAGSKLLITFTDVCVTTDNATVESFGLVEYNPANNTRGPLVRVFDQRVRGEGMAQHALLPQLALGSPIFFQGKLYLFAFRCTMRFDGVCTKGGAVFVARTGDTPASWQHASTYQFFDPAAAGSFTSNHARAASVIRGAAPLAVSAGDYAADGHGLALIEQTSLAGTLRVWTAPRPTGPWRSTNGMVPCGTAPAQHLNFCRALIGHPELSDRTHLAVSYFDPHQEHVLLTTTAY